MRNHSLSHNALLSVLVHFALFFSVFSQPNGAVVQTSIIGIQFEGDCTNLAYNCDNFTCPACFRFYLTGGDSLYVFFRFTYMGFVELDANGTEISSRQILPSNVVMTSATSQCTSCTEAVLTFTGSALLPNATVPTQFQFTNTLFEVATTVSDPANNTISVGANNMKVTIKVQNWPFLPGSSGLRMKMRAQSVGVLGISDWCLYTSGSTNCQNGGEQLSVFSLNGTTMTGYFVFFSNVSLSNDGSTWWSESANISGPWTIGSIPGSFIYVDVPLFNNSVVYDPTIGISTHSHLVPSMLLFWSALCVLILWRWC
jgi:hypothetical protein